MGDDRPLYEMQSKCNTQHLESYVLYLLFVYCKLPKDKRVVGHFGGNRVFLTFIYTINI